MQVLILRGLPGSGKSTFAERLAKKHQSTCILSADQWHVRSDGVYQFDPTQVAKAHNWCLERFTNEVLYPVPARKFVVMDNTNTTVWEVAPYYRLAEAFRFETVILHFHCTFEESCQRNVHNVPVGRIWTMQQNLLTERLPPHWNTNHTPYAMFPDLLLPHDEVGQ